MCVVCRAALRRMSGQFWSSYTLFAPGPVSIGQAALGLPTDARAITRPKNDWIRVHDPDEFRAPARRRYRVGSIHIQPMADGLEALFFPQFTCPRDSAPRNTRKTT